MKWNSYLQNFLPGSRVAQLLPPFVLTGLKVQSQKHSPSGSLGIVQNHTPIFKGYILHFDLAYTVKTKITHNNWTTSLQKDF